MKHLRRFASRSRVERRLFVRAAWLLALLRITLWLIPARTLRHRLARVGPRSANGPTATQVGWAVQVAARYVPGATCLVQAIAASVLLERAGLPAALRVGVAKPNESTLSAHAWVESAGVVVVGDGAHDRYHPLPAI